MLETIKNISIFFACALSFMVFFMLFGLMLILVSLFAGLLRLCGMRGHASSVKKRVFNLE